MDNSAKLMLIQRKQSILILNTSDRIWRNFKEMIRLITAY